MIVKRLLTSCLAVVMTISLIPAVVFADETAEPEQKQAAVVAKLGTPSPVKDSGKCGAHLNWVLDNGKLTISGYGNMYNYSSSKLPEWNKYKDVITSVSLGGAKSIGSYAFAGFSKLTSISIGSYVTSIGKCAFYGCSGLTKVSGGSKVKTIGSNAFKNCKKLSSFTITSKKLKKIGSYAFYNCSSLKTITIKNTTKLTRKGVKKSLKGSSVKKVKVKKSKKLLYSIYFLKKNSGKKVKVK